MIEKLSSKSSIEKFLKLNPIDNIYGLSYVEGYPFDDCFYKAYKCDDGYFILIDNIAYLYVDSINQELLSFFSFMGIQFVYSSFLLCNEAEFDKATVLYADREILSAHTVCNEFVDDKTVYNLLETVFNMPNFSVYKNSRIEQRHYLNSFCANILLAKELVSTATVSMQNSCSGLISCVATKKDMQNKGYATSVIASVSNSLLNSKKIPVIISDNCKVVNLYKKLGFKEKSKLYITILN